MKFSNILVVILLLLFSDLNVNAQIKIEAETAVSGQKFMIEIIELPTSYSLNLKVRDSISTNKMYENQMDKLREKYFNLNDKSIKTDSVKTILEEMENLTEKNSHYTTYKTDVIKAENKNFDDLIRLFKTESVDFIEKSEQNKNRIILDGTLIKISIKNDKGTKVIWSRSPNEKSHPKINNLITSSLSIFENKNLLQKDKKIAIGY